MAITTHTTHGPNTKTVQYTGIPDSTGDHFRGRSAQIAGNGDEDLAGGAGGEEGGNLTGPACDLGSMSDKRQ